MNDQVAFVSSLGDIQIIGDHFNKTYIQEQNCGIVEFLEYVENSRPSLSFRLSGDGLGLILVYNNRRIEYLNISKWEKTIVMDELYT